MTLFKGLDTYYVSEEDKFLRKIAKKLPLSESQKREIEKHKRIAELRDNPEAEDPRDTLWD